MNSRGKHWSFTLNNYTDEQLARFSQPLPGTTHHVIGLEVSASGTPHLQGHVSMTIVKRFSWMTNWIPGAHITSSRNLAHAIAYCKKDGDFREFGSPPTGAGARSDLDAFKASVKSGVVDFIELREIHSDVIAKYPQFCFQYVRDQSPQPILEVFPLRPWQAYLNEALNREPDSRTIYFCVDEVGNAGKTWFAKYYCSRHPTAQYLEPGKKADMAYALQDNLRVLFIDVTRQAQEHFQYSFFESVKNGMVFSPKYVSQMRRFPNVHVAVMMNQKPNESMLSADRIHYVPMEE